MSTAEGSRLRARSRRRSAPREQLVPTAASSVEAEPLTPATVAPPTVPAPAVPPPAVSPPAALEPLPTGRPRATRVPDGSMLGGVCTGLAQHLGWPVLAVRFAFVALTLFQLLGVLAYGVLWLLMPVQPAVAAPGLESATRAGLRKPASARRRVDWGPLLALVVLGTGLLGMVQASGHGVSPQLFWPIAFACLGAALVWRQADSTQRGRSHPDAAGRSWLAPLVARGGWLAVIRVIVGLGLVGAAFGLVVAQWGQLSQLPEVLTMTAMALAGLAVVVAPWVYRSRLALNTARAEKVRADARADMAAHLHDSVLQTLALIQRQSEDPRAIQQLARRQERELRTWLYGEELSETTLKAALTTAAAEVEDERGVPVELVVVGDAEPSDAVQSLVRAAREAMVNAAKHSGADKIDVYAEVEQDRVEVFVRDRGNGFRLDAVPEDRMGVRGSIIDRMARHGGTATVRSQPGDGTEVRLEIRR